MVRTPTSSRMTREVKLPSGTMINSTDELTFAYKGLVVELVIIESIMSGSN